MERVYNQIQGETLFVGINLHKRSWHITIRTVDVEIFSNRMVGRWDNLRRILE